jgi:LuxR family maltose regulon positive regulatory protein
VIEDLESRAQSREPSVVAFLESEAVEIYPATIERLVLSRREAEVLRGLSDGLPIADIARKLFVTQNTMKSHVRRLYRKLGVHSRDEAVAAAHRLSLLDVEPERQRSSP